MIRQPCIDFDNISGTGNGKGKEISHTKPETKRHQGESGENSIRYSSRFSFSPGKTKLACNQKDERQADQQTPQKTIRMVIDSHAGEMNDSKKGIRIDPVPAQREFTRRRMYGARGIATSIPATRRKAM